jgi:large subunit ribosomal protein L25
LWHALKKEAFHASVLQMELNGKTTEVLLRDVQYHPFKQLVLHIDFQRIDANTKMKKKVPLHYSGEENSPAFKVDKCLINRIATELEISCMPKDLPEFIAVDLSNLVKGHSLHAKDITLPAGVTVVAPGTSNPVLVAVVATKAEEPTPQEAAAAAGDNKKKK